jgi:hypothetical protein
MNYNLGHAFSPQAYRHVVCNLIPIEFYMLLKTDVSGQKPTRELDTSLIAFNIHQNNKQTP